MNKRPSPADRDRLLADVYREDWTSGPASALATHAARTVRRQRAVRQWVATVSVVALLASGAWWSAIPPHPAARRAASTHGCETIPDAELMSCLQDRSAIVFPDANGRPQVVWLLGG
ncbi:MAG TPA: hypothetical protein VMC06_08120 [Opitutaceae bacterium]|nr:hypothetical protein [Opitutaceae bacterium]